ncbi:MAG: type I-E CRISPR-associated protein Cas7/Cse4/CasC [Nocardiopsaceae bacterium]|nr:type I-E CRISPR-associated protein Cas7/Cse4/CasC [Nocardiopsaceae bacterium]
MNTPRYIDVHALQTVPYANLNRDDLGAPKTLMYGGAERTRVSSQSWKRAVRHEIEDRLGQPAVRTRRIIQAVTDRLAAQGWDEDLALAGSRQVVLSAGGKEGFRAEEGKDITSVTFYLPAAGLDELAAIVAEHKEQVAAQAGKKKPTAVLPKDRVEAVLRSRNATIQLMGRMLAELPGAEVDGAVQFAHAFTTHATYVETDFFTAVDDIEKIGDAGSAHMNAAQFSAGTFYRYANIGLGTLADNLDGDTATAHELATEFLRAFITTIPSGKQNATAAMTIPDLVYIAVRADRPISLAPAFEHPVSSQAGYAEPSRQNLSDYAARLHEYWGSEGLAWHGHAALADKPAPGLGDHTASLTSLVDQAIAAAFPAPEPR